MGGGHLKQQKVGSWFYLYIYMPNPLFQTLSTTAVISFDLHKAQSTGALSGSDEYYSITSPASLQNFDSDFRTNSQKYPPKSR
jgi:hypothetical protein